MVEFLTFCLLAFFLLFGGFGIIVGWFVDWDEKRTERKEKKE